MPPRSRVDALSLVGARLSPTLRVTGVIGSGGMGVVLRAMDESLEREVAVKLVSDALAADPVAVQELLAEARMMATVCHENVATIHSFSPVADNPYYVMELVEGANLDQLLEAGQTFGTGEALRLLTQLACGLDAIHRASVVHRDLKPSNVLVGPGFRVVITDFGLAQGVTSGEHAPSSSSARGSPGYSAPEVLLGAAEVGPRADVYSFGAVAFRLLTGRSAFAPSAERSVIDTQLERRMPPRCEALPHAAQEALHSSLAIDPASRPGSAGELVAALRSALGSPRTTRPALRFVVVDDDIEMRTWLATTLMGTFPQAHVVCVSDGKAALGVVDHPSTDLVVTDLAMPDLDGVGLTQALRASAHTRDIPILVVTAVGRAPDWQLLRELGANAFLAKPLDAEQVTTTVRRLLGVGPG